MIKQLKIARAIAGLLSWSCLYFSCLACALCFFDDSPRQIITALIMILPFAGTVILSFYARHILFYVGYHLLLIALTWVLSQTVSLFGPITAGVLTASLIIQMSIFFSRRLHHRDSQNFLKLSPVLAVIFFVIWIFSNGMGMRMLPGLLAAAASVYLLAAVLGIYLTNMIGYIDSNKEMANMPVYALIHSGNGQITIFMLLALTAILLFTNIGLDRLFHQLKNLLLSGIRFLFSLAPNNTETVVESAQPAPQMPSIDAPEMDAGEPSEIILAINDVFITIVQIVMIAGAAALIIYLIWQLWQRFNGIRFQKKSRRKDTPENEDIIEKLTAPEGRRIFRLRPGMPEDKIRKIYYKKIQSGHKKNPVPSHMTPEELTDSIRPADSGAAREFTRIYEQARYSDRPPETDASAYKTLAKKL